MRGETRSPSTMRSTDRKWVALLVLSVSIGAAFAVTIIFAG